MEIWPCWHPSICIPPLRRPVERPWRATDSHRRSVTSPAMSRFRHLHLTPKPVAQHSLLPPPPTSQPRATYLHLRLVSELREYSRRPLIASHLILPASHRLAAPFRPPWLPHRTPTSRCKSGYWPWPKRSSVRGLFTPGPRRRCPKLSTSRCLSLLWSRGTDGRVCSSHADISTQLRGLPGTSSCQPLASSPTAFMAPPHFELLPLSCA